MCRGVGGGGVGVPCHLFMEYFFIALAGSENGAKMNTA